MKFILAFPITELEDSSVIFITFNPLSSGAVMSINLLAPQDPMNNKHMLNNAKFPNSFLFMTLLSLYIFSQKYEFLFVVVLKSPTYNII